MNKEQLQVLLMESLVSLKTQGVLEKVPENIFNFLCQLSGCTPCLLRQHHRNIRGKVPLGFIL
jgi:hypothetical protein